MAWFYPDCNIVETMVRCPKAQKDLTCGQRLIGTNSHGTMVVREHEIYSVRGMVLLRDAYERGGFAMVGYVESILEVVISFYLTTILCTYRYFFERR